MQSFQSPMLSLKKFTRVKSICIQLLSSFNNPLLFKWKIKFENKLDSLLFLSPNSIYHNNVLYDKQNSHEDEEMDMKMKNKIAFLLLMDAKISHGRMISYSGEKITEIRNCLTPPYETIKDMLSKKCASQGRSVYAPLLKLPIYGLVMKEVTLLLWERKNLSDDISFLKTDMLDDDYKDEEGNAYNEAMKEMLKERNAYACSMNHVPITISYFGCVKVDDHMFMFKRYFQ